MQTMDFFSNLDSAIQKGHLKLWSYRQKGNCSVLVLLLLLEKTDDGILLEIEGALL